MSAGPMCPLRYPWLAAPPFASPAEATRATRIYASTTDPEQRRIHAHSLFRRHALLVRKALARHCAGSRCAPGLCRPYEMVADAFLVFQKRP